MATIKCTNCGELSSDSNVCQHCGSQLTIEKEAIEANSNEVSCTEQDKDTEEAEAFISEQNNNEISEESASEENILDSSEESTPEENKPECSTVTTSEADNTVQEVTDTSNKYETVDSTESPCIVENSNNINAKENMASNKINNFVETLKNDKKKLYILIAVIAILIGIGFLVANNINKNNYKENMVVAHTKMLSGGASAEEACNLIKSVWYNTIWDEYDPKTSKYTSGTDDFNTALSRLFSDSEFQTDIKLIEYNQQEVEEIMDKLKNPPAEYEKCYDALLEMHANYLRLTNLAISPEGSLTSFSSEFREADTALANSYSFVENLLP